MWRGLRHWVPNTLSPPTAGSCVMNAGVPPYVRACVLARACMSYMRVVRAGMDAPGAGEWRCPLKAALNDVRKA